jgi:hypothetical protein
MGSERPKNWLDFGDPYTVSLTVFSTTLKESPKPKHYWTELEESLFRKAFHSLLGIVIFVNFVPKQKHVVDHYG